MLDSAVLVEAPHLLHDLNQQAVHSLILQAEVIALIPRLLCICRPTDITRFVVSVRVRPSV